MFAPFSKGIQEMDGGGASDDHISTCKAKDLELGFFKVNSPAQSRKCCVDSVSGDAAGLLNPKPRRISNTGRGLSHQQSKP